MDKITKVDYLKYAIDNRLHGNLNWIYAVLSLGVDDNEFTKIKDGKIYVNVDDNYIELITTTLPIFTKEVEMTVPIDYIPNITAEVTTNAFIILVNVILLTNNFNNKVDFINGDISIGKIESQLTSRLTEDKDSSTDITIPELLNFQNAVTYMLGFAPLVVNSNSPLLLLPPPGIKAYKKKAIEIVKKKHKIDEISELTHIAEVEEMLIEFDNEFLKNDPSYGKFISGKIKNARKKMFLSYGAEAGFGGDKPFYAVNSLYEGWENTPEALTTYINGSRAGSYGRGAETAKGGSLAKIALRATQHIKVKYRDCGSKLGMEIHVDKFTKDGLTGKSIIENGKIIKVDDVDKYIGKDVTVRSPAYCIEPKGHICSVCIGDNLSRNESSIPGAISDYASFILHIAMKNMHVSHASLVTLTTEDMCT